MEAALVAVRLLHLSSTATLFGLALFPLYARTEPPGVRIAAIIALASGLAWLLVATASMSGRWAGVADGEILSVVVLGTDFGKVWLGRLAALLILTCSPIPVRGRLLLSIAALASIALTGHAVIGEGSVGAVHRAADALHLLAAGGWLGGLIALAAVLRRFPSVRQAAVLRAFSSMGFIAVGTLAATGLINAVLLLHGPMAIFTTNYGRLLLLKIALFAGMLLLAAFNRFWLTPLVAQGSRDAIRHLKRSVAYEQLLGGAVLAVVALLGTLDPTA